jgi:hypothetical protein
MTDRPELRALLTCGGEIIANKDDGTVSLQHVARGAMAPAMPSAESPVLIPLTVYVDLFSRDLDDVFRLSIVAYGPDGISLGRVDFPDDWEHFSGSEMNLQCAARCELVLEKCGDCRIVALWGEHELGECWFDLLEPGSERRKGRIRTATIAGESARVK